MDSTKLIALVAAGSSGSSLLSGSLFSGSSAHGASVKLINPFLNFDLECLEKKAKSSKKTIFAGFDEETDQPRLLTSVRDGTLSSPFNLPKPTPNSDNVEGCYKANFHQTSDYQVIGANVEMAASRGNYGFVLLNAIANMKDYGGKTIAYRAVFLEKSSNKWQIKGGIQWSDEALLRASQNSRRIHWNNKITNQKDIIWYKDFTDEFPYPDLVTKYNHPESFVWKKDATKQHNIYQDLSVKPESQTSTDIQDFWNGKEEPLDANSSISRPVALFDINDRVWKRAPRGCCKDVKTNVQAWFNLFKDEKGEWEQKK